jgi:membrane fusion protein, multidrug efflux system
MSQVPTAGPSERPGPRRRLWILAIVLAVIAFLYFVPDLFVAYTEDAYVRSDFVEVAPEIAGVVNHVEVANDQKVTVGSPLVTIDPKPFDLAIDLAQRQVDQASSATRVKQDEAKVLAAQLDGANASVTLAQRDYERYAALVKDQTVSQEIMDRATDARQKALDAVAGVQARIRVNGGAVETDLADVDVAKAQLALAQYNRSQTRIQAPVAGYVTNLSLRPGAYARIGEPILGLVDDSQWRVVANFKEYVASRLKPGMRAWIWLDAHP